MLEQRKQRHPSWLAYDPIPDLGGQDEERWLNGFAGLPLHCFNCCAYEGDGFIAPTRLNGDDAGRSGEELSELFMLVIPSGEEQLGRQRGEAALNSVVPTDGAPARRSKLRVSTLIERMS